MKKFISIIIVLVIIGVAAVIVSSLFTKKSGTALIPNQAPNTTAQTPPNNTPATPSSPTTNPTTPPVATPPGRTLTSKPWQWVATTLSNGTQTIPKNPSRFSLVLKADGSFSSTTDCNGIGGKYEIKDDTITFTQMMSTQMFCVGSQQSDYQTILDNARAFKITSDGQLRIDLKYGQGFALFK